RGRYQVIQPKVRDNVAVVLIVVRRILEQHIESRSLVSFIGRQSRLAVRLSIGPLAEVVRDAQCLDHFGLRFRSGARPATNRFLPERETAIAVLRSSDMIESLTEAANVGRRLVAEE